MLQGEHSAIPLTSIKLSFILSLRSLFCLFLSNSTLFIMKLHQWTGLSPCIYKFGYWIRASKNYQACVETSLNP